MVPQLGPSRPAPPRLDLPEWRADSDDAVRVTADIDAWAHSAALSELVAVFGGSPADGADLDALDAFSKRIWEFREGRERDQSVERQLTTEQINAVATHAAVLGLAGRESPRRRHYDAVILTGGMVRAGIVKPRFAVELMAQGIRFNRVVFLGAHRPFSPEERLLARTLGVPGDDEISGMHEGVRRAFHLGDPSDVTISPKPTGPAAWGRWRWAHVEPAVEVVAAASADPAHRRANTADTCRFWADRYADDARSVLVVTTPIYVPYQSAVAVETLGLGSGMTVETVGVSATASDLGASTQPFTARHHLQELRSAIRGMASLRRAVQSRSHS